MSRFVDSQQDLNELQEYVRAFRATRQGLKQQVDKFMQATEDMERVWNDRDFSAFRERMKTLGDRVSQELEVAKKKETELEELIGAGDGVLRVKGRLAR